MRSPAEAAEAAASSSASAGGVDPEQVALMTLSEDEGDVASRGAKGVGSSQQLGRRESHVYHIAGESGVEFGGVASS